MGGWGGAREGERYVNIHSGHEMACCTSPCVVQLHQSVCCACKNVLCTHKHKRESARVYTQTQERERERACTHTHTHIRTTHTREWVDRWALGTTVLYYFTLLLYFIMRVSMRPILLSHAGEGFGGALRD